MIAAPRDTQISTGKYCSSGNTAVSTEVTEKLVVPAELAWFTSQEVSGVSIPNNRGRLATMRKRPRSSVKSVTAMPAATKQSR